MSTLETQVARVALEAEEKAKEAAALGAEEVAREDCILAPPSDPWDAPWGALEMRKYALQLAVDVQGDADAGAIVDMAKAFLEFLREGGK